MDIERLVGDDLLELAVFLLQVLQPMGLGDFHPTVLSLPAVVGLFANAVPAAQVRQIDSGLSFIEDGDHLVGREPAFLHGLPLGVVGWKTCISHFKWFTFPVACQGGLSSSMDRAKNLFYYTGANLPELAAAYGHGLAKNHCFIDGNKRIAFAVINMFLRMNDYELVVTEQEAVNMMLRVASSDATQEDLSKWIVENIQSRPLL
jgi:death on curing protein